MKVLEDKNNELLSRREIKLVITSEKNPSFPEAENLISENFKADKELIIINGIKGKFGRDTFLISARIYKNREEKEKLEKKKDKNQPAAEDKK